MDASFTDCAVNWILYIIKATSRTIAHVSSSFSLISPVHAIHFSSLIIFFHFDFFVTFPWIRPLLGAASTDNTYSSDLEILAPIYWKITFTAFCLSGDDSTCY